MIVIGRGDQIKFQQVSGCTQSTRNHLCPLCKHLLVSSTKQMLFGKAVVVAKQLLKSPSEAWHSFARGKKKRIPSNARCLFNFRQEEGKERLVGPVAPGCVQVNSGSC